MAKNPLGLIFVFLVTVLNEVKTPSVSLANMGNSSLFHTLSYMHQVHFHPLFTIPMS